MNLNIARAILINNFGRHSWRPWRAAMSRLGFSFGVAMVIGILGFRAVNDLSLASDLPGLWVCSLISLLSFSVSGLIGLGLSSIGLDNGAPNSLQTLARSWPLQRFDLIVLEILPIAIVWLALITGVSAPIYGLAGVMKAPLILVMACTYLFSAIGLLAGFGLWPRNLLQRLLLIIGEIVVSGALLEQSIQSTRLFYAGVAFVPLVAIVIIQVYHLWGLDQLSPTRQRIQKTRKTPLRLLQTDWLGIKFLRNKRSRNSIQIILGLALTTSVVTLYRHLDMRGSLAILLFASCLSVSLATDARGLCRRYKPIEIYGVKDYISFLKRLVPSLWLISLVANLPLLAIYILPNAVSIGSIASFIISQLLAVSIGLVASTIFVPESGELGPQFMAGSIATTILVAIIIKSSDRAGRLWAWLSISVLCWLVVYLSEQIRRTRYGHV